MTLHVIQLGRGFGPVETTVVEPPETIEPPVIAATVADNQIKVTISGASDATHTLMIKRFDAAEWTTGPSRVGDGEIILSGLDAGTYYIIAYSVVAGQHSPPSNLVVATETGTVPVDADGNIMRRGIKYLAEKMRLHTGESILYKQDGIEFVTKAVFGKTDIDVVSEEEFRIVSCANDFIVSAADMCFNGLPIWPKQGDVIETQVSGLFEVLYLPAEGCWRYSDPFGTMYRIHTKKIKATNGEQSI